MTSCKFCAILWWDGVAQLPDAAAVELHRLAGETHKWKA